jgi:glycosyltransferase involved in cell wall biosynthesis
MMAGAMAIYYACPDVEMPYGGVRVVYRHVDILNAAGHEAYVLHTRAPFRCTWFDHDTPIRYVHEEPLEQPLQEYLRSGAGVHASVRRIGRAASGRARRAATATRTLAEDDVLAVSEVISSHAYRLYPGTARVIFNQGTYQTFIGWDAADDPYARDDLLGAMTVSEDGEAYLRFAFGARGWPIVRVHYSIDQGVFAYGAEKRRQIAYIPQKNPNDVHQVLSILGLRGVLDGWDLVALDGLTEREVAAVLRESALFLTFGHPEGFGRPPLEALSCGCAVIGYHGLGGREFFRLELGAQAIEPGDVRAYVEAVERFLATYDAEAAHHSETGRAASEFVAASYSPEQEERDVVAAWRRFLDSRERERDAAVE